jgi:hypothetical protein
MYLNLTDRVLTDTYERGAKGVACHPGFSSNGLMFVTYNFAAGGTNFVRLSKFTNSNPASEVVLEGFEVLDRLTRLLRGLDRLLLTGRFLPGTVHPGQDVTTGPPATNRPVRHRHLLDLHLDVLVVRGDRLPVAPAISLQEARIDPAERPVLGHVHIATGVRERGLLVFLLPCAGAGCRGRPC